MIDLKKVIPIMLEVLILVGLICALCTTKCHLVHNTTVTATMYYPCSEQCDSDPLTTAGMFKIDPEHASDLKWIAVSRDLLSKAGGDFEYGDFVRVEGTEHKDGIYRVVDTMNKRYKNRIDFLETKGTPTYTFENVTIHKIEE